MWKALFTALVILQAGWMTFDGLRALIVGDYVTPSSGTHAGQLGPWSRAVAFFGINPRGTGMKAFFVIFGLAWLAALTAWFVAPTDLLRSILAGFAIGSLWYAPIGTSLSFLQLVLLLASPI